MNRSDPRIAAVTDQPADATFPMPSSAPPVESVSTGEPSLNIQLGRQLRSAREARQLGIEECAEALRLPVRVLMKLEAGDYTGISDGVYLRNYLTSYGICVGLKDAVIQGAIRQLAPSEQQPALVSTGGTSRSHYLWHRYTTAATYAVLTAVIVVPLVWLGLKGGLDRELARLEPLAPTPTSQQATAPADGNRATGVADVPHVEKPLMASMAPFSALDSVNVDTPVAPAPSAPPPPAVVATRHTLTITLSQPSWVEVTAADGKRLEYNLLPAGAHKFYDSTQPLQISIGDTAAARVRVNGKNVDLSPYAHANVAHFRVVPTDGTAVVQTM